VQLWQCKLCRRVFTPAPPALRYKTRPLRLILDGVTFYTLAYSLPEAMQKIKSMHGYKIPPSTLASWMSEHRELTTYNRPRLISSNAPSLQRNILFASPHRAEPSHQLCPFGARSARAAASADATID
jgi:hypothetical protein